MNNQIIMACGSVLLIFASGCLLVSGYFSKRITEIKSKYHSLKKSISENNVTVPEIQIKDKVSLTNVSNSSYESILKKFESLCSSQISVLSDELGLPVASSSDRCEELATVSVLFMECSQRLKRSIGFDDLLKIEFTDKENRSLTVFPIAVQNQTVYFSGISRGKPDHDSLISD